jgi:HlyD family secretion protein
MVAVAIRTGRTGAVQEAPRTHVVTSGPVVGHLELRGSIEAERTVRIGSPAPGQVTSVAVVVGARVKRGQVLARLDDVEQRASLATADAQLTTAELDATQAEARLMNELELLEGEGKLPDGLLPYEILDGDAGEAQIALMTAAAALEQRVATVRKARQLAARRVLRAPFDGVVLAKTVEAGETIAASPPGPPLFIVGSDPARLLVRADVDDPLVARIQPGPARLAVPAVPGGSFPATIRQVSIGQKSGGSPARYQALLAVENRDGLLAPGMSVTVRLPMTSPPDTLWLPLGAIDGARTPTPAVWVVSGVLPPRRVPVKLGVSDGRLVEVGGIAAGQAVLARVDP